MADITSKRLIATLEKQVNESDTSTYEVGEQRERNHRYYSLEPLGNERPGRSHYISPDVLDAVEGKKAIFSEAFLSSRQVAKFTNCPYPGEAEQKTVYVNRTMRRNRYERLMRDAWHDAFVAKRCVFFVDWEPDTKEVTLNFQGAPAPVVNQQIQQLNGISANFEGATIQTMPSIQGPIEVLTGQVVVSVPDGYAKIELIQPERFFRDPEATYPDDSAWCTWQEDMTRGELISRGFDEEQVMSLSQEYRFRSDEEDAARKSFDSSWTRRRQHNRTDEQELVSYFRTRTWLEWDEEQFSGIELDFEPPAGVVLYDIQWSQGEVLIRDDGFAAIRIVPEMGVFEWSEMKVAHAENGLCTADVEAHTQKTSSQLKRLIIDNQEMQNTTRWLARVNAFKNPADFTRNRIGDVVWTNTDLAQAAMPLPTPELSAMTFQTVQMLKQDGEERSGLSALSKGMNTDAVKYQNADNMIARLTTAGQRRVAMEARDFANTCWVEICRYMVTLAKRFDTSVDVMEVRGQQVMINPQLWQDDEHEMTVRTALTTDENTENAQQLLMLHGIQSQDPQMAVMYGPEQRHALFDTVYELMGIDDSSPYLLSPQSPQYQQMMMSQQQQQQMLQQQQAQVTQFQQGLLRNNQQLQWAKFEWDKIDDISDNIREDYKAQVDAKSKEVELELRGGTNG